MTTDNAELPGYSIRAASKLTGISADTLRMWERRYGFPRPARSDRGQRMYSAADIERLRWIARALAAGHRAGDVVRRPAEALRDLLEAPSRLVEAAEPIEALRDGNAELLRRLLADRAEGVAPDRYVAEVATPLVTEVNAALARRQLAARHRDLLADLLSTQLRLMLALLDDLAGAPLVAIGTLPGEPHRLSLDMAALFAAASGAAVRVAGAACPPAQVVDVAMAVRAHAVLIPILSPRDSASIRTGLQGISASLPERIRLWALTLHPAFEPPAGVPAGDNWSWLEGQLSAA